MFPQFADSGPLPKHGWLRTTEWDVASHDGSTGVTLRTEESPESMLLWPHTYDVRLRVELDAASLEVTLIVRNPGAEAFGFTSALHSYLAVPEISRAELRGLYGIPYIDKTADRAIVRDNDRALRITRETDRIYTGVKENLELVDGESMLSISSRGFPDVVVWNPWTEVAKGISDMGDDDYRRFMCVEAAVADKAVMLLPGESWEGTQRLELIE